MICLPPRLPSLFTVGFRKRKVRFRMPFSYRPTFERMFRLRWITPMLLRMSAFFLVCLLVGAVAKLRPAAAGDGKPELNPGSDTIREIAPSGKEQFEISLSPGQLLRLSVEKGDVPLVLALYDPEGQKLIEQASHAYEVLEWSLAAGSAGMYRLEISSLERVSSRQYRLRVEPIVTATANDQKINSAQQAIATASLLRADWTEKSLRRAIENYDQAALVWLSLGNSRSAAIASMNAGSVCFALGDYREAQKRYQKAADEAKTAAARLEQSQALSQIARLYSLLGNNDAAQENLQKALEFLALDREGDQPATVKQAYAQALSNRGEINYSKGDLVKSLRDFDHALTLFKGVGDRAGEARVHLFKGYIAGGIGDPDKAVAEISDSLSLFKAVADRAGEGMCLTVLGVAYSSRDKDRAMELHREAREIFRTIGDRSNEAITLNGLGQTYGFLKDYTTALSNYQQALRLFLDNGSLDFAAVTMFKVAQTYQRSGDTQQALAYYEKCLKLSRDAKKSRTEVNALNEMADIYALQGSREKTVTQYQKILKFYETISDRRGQAKALNNLGNFLLKHGEKRPALDLYKRALPLSEQAGDKDVLVSTLYNIARANRDLGDLEEALARIQQAIKIIEELRSNVATPDFRTSYFAGVSKQYELYIDILMQLARQRPEQGFEAAGLRESENTRARSLVDLMTESRANIRQGAAPALLERERELQGLLRSQAQYQMELSTKGTSKEEHEEIVRQMDQLRAEYQDVQTQLRNQNPRFTTLAQQPPLSLEQIQAELRDEDTILLEYALGDERSYLWAVTGDSLRTYELPGRKILEEAGREVYDLITARQTTSGKVDGSYQSRVAASDQLYPEKALKLSNLLFGQVSAQLGSKRLLIVSEGILQYIPMDALPGPRAQAAGQTSQSVSDSAQNLPPLIATHEIVTLPSVSTLLAIRQEKQRQTPGNMVVAVLADPVFGNNDDRVQNTNKPSANAVAADGTSKQTQAFQNAVRGNAAARLVHASEEADAILAATPWGAGMVAKGFDANREVAMSSLVGKYRIVHFATHGFLNGEHPELSGIVLSTVNPDGSRANGFMPLQDIYNLNLSADLVVLSACETALGKDIKGEGLVGLTRGFMSAGSRSVVASLWKVDDRATATLMKAFYKAMLQDGLTPAAALRVAKEEVRQQEAWKAPYFWAGFVLQGEYKEHIVVNRDSGLRTGVAIAITLVVISFAPPILRRRRRRASHPRR